MWWLISVLYALVGLVTFRYVFQGILKRIDQGYDRLQQDRVREHKVGMYCTEQRCSGRGHVPGRPQLDTKNRVIATSIGLGVGVFWLPIALAKVFWKLLFPKGVLAESKKERKARLKKEKEAEEQELLKKAKEMGLPVPGNS